MRTVYLPAVERRVSLRAYLKAIRTALKHLDDQFDHGLTCWWPVTGREIRRQFLEGIHDRINQAIPYSKRGLT